MNPSNLFHTNGYQILPSVIPGKILESLLEHALKMASQPGLAPGDSQVLGTPAIYADPRMELLLARLTSVVEAEAGVAVYPTYSYFRVYKKGDKLDKHKDRPSCEISLSLSLGYDPDEPWPLWVEGASGPTALRINRGDAVLYKGTEIAHWREEFQGNYAAQVFLHYVDQDGPYREWKFDKREKGLNQLIANAAAASARDPETEKKSSRLDLGLDSIVLLKKQAPFSMKNIATAASFQGWLENLASEGERWLRNAAADGDLYAMEKLGRRLLAGDGLDKAVEEGLGWLRKSAELGNPFAMEKLAEYEFYENETPGSSAEGERWLRNAVERGYRLAIVNLGTRLITGNCLTSDPRQGEQLLCEAAREGSQLAMIKLGIYLLSGWGLDQNQEEGLRWLRRAGATNASQLLELGLYLYQKSLTATTKAARGIAKEASVLFQEACRQGNRTASLNLAYLLRRGEITGVSLPPLDELLSEHLKQKDSFAFVNQALRLARGIQCNTDWKAADSLFGKLQDSGNVLEWWFARSREGDPEGHLVTGWLGRHQLAIDPDGFQIAKRMDLARNGGWRVPEWMNDPATAGQNA